MLRKIILFSILFPAIVLCAQAREIQTSQRIIVNKPLSADDSRYEYPKKLLNMILKQTESEFGPWEIVESTHNMSRNRAFKELKRGELLHVMAEAPKPGWEEELIPVRIPIRKGIQGFRTFLILSRHQKMLSNITSLDELKMIPTGSGAQWSTTKVLESNGFNVVKGNSYEGLFGMLVNERFITFGRGINETRPEYEARTDKYPDLAIEKDLLLYIPLPTYYFVTPQQKALAERIEKGLTELIASGMFDEFFNDEFGTLIEKENVSNRRVFKISNPNLSKETPLDKTEYWYQP